MAPVDGRAGIDGGPPGSVILLAGPSSSGKSSIGLALQGVLDDPWFFVPVDQISGMRSLRHRRVLDEAGIAEMLRRTRRGYHRVVRGLTDAGNDVIMDYPITEAWRLADLVTVLEGIDVFTVEVVCDPVELERRERARGDRIVGTAVAQRSHLTDRDLVVDTTATDAETCAEAIARAWGAPRDSTAFDRIRAPG